MFTYRFSLSRNTSWIAEFEQDRRGLPLSLPAPSLHIVQKVKERSLHWSVIETLGLASFSGDPSRVSGSFISIVLSDRDSQPGAIPPLLFEGKYKDQTSYLDKAEYLKEYSKGNASMSYSIRKRPCPKNRKEYRPMATHVCMFARGAERDL